MQALFVGTLDGVFKIFRGKQGWEIRSRNLAGLEVDALAIHPAQRHVVYAGVRDGGRLGLLLAAVGGRLGLGLAGQRGVGELGVDGGRGRLHVEAIRLQTLHDLVGGHVVLLR